MSIIEAVIGSVLDALERDPQLRARVRELLQHSDDRTVATREPAPLYLAVGAFAARVGYSKRHVEHLVREGLPLIGAGRARRVPVAAAEQWLAQRGDRDARAAERARLDAARAAGARAARLAVR
jgi:hypothetical protein